MTDAATEGPLIFGDHLEPRGFPPAQRAPKAEYIHFTRY
jgi:hypothetical protein